MRSLVQGGRKGLLLALVAAQQALGLLLGQPHLLLEVAVVGGGGVGVFRHRLFSHKTAVYVPDLLLHLVVLGRLALLLGLCLLLGEKVEDVLFALSLAEEGSRVAVLHLVLMERRHLHFHGILPLFLLEWSYLLFELYPYGLGVGEGPCIGVVLLFIILFLLFFLIAELEAILMTAGVVFLGTSRRKCLFVVLLEVEVPAEFGGLGLSEVGVGVYAAGSGSVQPAIGKHVGGVGIEGTLRRVFSPAWPVEVQRFVKGIGGEEKLIALDDKIGNFLRIGGIGSGRLHCVILQLGKLLLRQQRDLFLLAIIEGQESNFRLMAHPAPRSHKNLELLVLGNGQRVWGQLQLDPQRGQF